MEKGTIANFADNSGNKHTVTISDKHINALMSHAGNRSVPIHKTHEWLQAEGKPNADSVEMDSRIGALKNFRKNNNGDLIADAYLKDGADRQDILWMAKNNPENTMFSAVYNFKSNDPDCLPTNFRAGDIVPDGASVTALFSTTTTDPMDINELIEALKDPKVQAAVSAIIKSHKEDAADSDSDTAAAAEMESDAGVTEADKKKEDDQKPALMRAALRCNRALVRQSKSIAIDETALLAKAKTAGEAGATAVIGSGKFIKADASDPGADEYTAALSEYKKTAPSDTVAAMRLLKDKPHLFEAHNNHTRARMAKLVPAS